MSFFHFPLNREGCIYDSGWIVLVVGVSRFASLDYFLHHHYYLSRPKHVLTRLELLPSHVGDMELGDMELLARRLDSTTFHNNISITSNPVCYVDEA